MCNCGCYREQPNGSGCLSPDEECPMNPERYEALLQREEPSDWEERFFATRIFRRTSEPETARENV